MEINRYIIYDSLQLYKRGRAAVPTALVLRRGEESKKRTVIIDYVSAMAVRFNWVTLR